jgi:hypothetical protein
VSSSSTVKGGAFAADALSPKSVADATVNGRKEATAGAAAGGKRTAEGAAKPAKEARSDSFAPIGDNFKTLAEISEALRKNGLESCQCE